MIAPPSHRCIARPHPPADLMPFQVQLQVSGELGFSESVRTHLTQELRALPDVELDPGGLAPTHRVYVLVLAARNQVDECRGLVLSCISTTPALGMTPGFTNAQDQRKVSDYLHQLDLIQSHWIQTGAVSELPNLCGQTVRTFEKSSLEKSRAVLREWQTRVKVSQVRAIAGQAELAAALFGRKLLSEVPPRTEQGG